MPVELRLGSQKNPSRDYTTDAPTLCMYTRICVGGGMDGWMDGWTDLEARHLLWPFASRTPAHGVNRLFNPLAPNDIYIYIYIYIYVVPHS